MNRTSRILIAAASLALTAAYVLPVWKIDLAAPQYPEGLGLQIWLNRITGDVSTINGLNHYIGMKKISADMFPEFTYLPYAAAFLVGLGLLTALANSRRLLSAYLCLLVSAGLAALYDFYRWGYDYGHHLDPAAAIQVPGFSYQPPVIGHKQLLNFDAWSYPAAAGWIVVAAFGVLLGVWIKETLKQKHSARQLRWRQSAALLPFLLFLLPSCTTGPQPFAYGKDGCHFCKMTIITPGFGGELITRKGKIYKFDDLHCLLAFLKKGEIKAENIDRTLVADFKNDNRFLEAATAAYVQGGQLHSPMNANTAALADAATAATVAQTTGGKRTDWNTLYNSFRP
ncbi:nitrous oxide reductase accessory protein NosL [Paraflavisolibacter sp. H34]|uniref:nitrous oxide reductase accessory protein NosL n=1 Tax=Huijunlia imazamoxiresistens TaxID=3127457 RepID=UPI0030158C23